MMGFKEFYEADDSKYKIYVDLDGTLTDWEGAFKKLSPNKNYDEYKEEDDIEAAWKLIHAAGEEFWSEMKWLDEGKKLWDFVKDLYPTILTSPGTRHTDVIKKGKNEWIDRELGKNVERIIDKNKKKYASQNAILIDDDEDNIEKWVNSDGIGILFKNADDTIKQIKQFLVFDEERQIWNVGSPVKNFNTKKFFNTRKLRKHSKAFDFL